MIDRVVYRREVLICLTSVFLFFLRADFLQGKSYAVGYNQYLAGDFVTAERSFRDALTNSGSTSEQSRIHKMLGITQYMQGKRVEAEKSFKRSKTLNPRIRISKDEVLDESIIDFFDGIQVRRVKPSAAPPTATKDSSLNKETYLRVVSNVRHARIVVDSRHRGGPGALIPVRPGIHEVEVYAKNYNRVGLPIEVLKGRVNDVTINLQKIKSELKTDSRSEISAAKDVKAKKKVKKRKKRKKRRLKRLPPKSTTKETGSFTKRVDESLYFLPFGLSHFLEGSYLWGSMYALTQISGLGFYAYKFSEENRILDESNDEIAIRDEQQKALSDDQKQAFYEESLQIFNENKERADAVATESYLGLTLFATFWLGSVLHSYLKAPKRTLSLVQGPDSEGSKSGAFADLGSPTVEPRWHLLPRLVSTPAGTSASLALDFRLDF